MRTIHVPIKSTCRVAKRTPARMATFTINPGREPASLTRHILAPTHICPTFSEGQPSATFHFSCFWFIFIYNTFGNNLRSHVANCDWNKTWHGLFHKPTWESQLRRVRPDMQNPSEGLSIKNEDTLSYGISEAEITGACSGGKFFEG